MPRVTLVLCVILIRIEGGTCWLEGLKAVRMKVSSSHRDKNMDCTFVHDHRWASVSDTEASVSPSHSDWVSSTGLSGPDDIEEDEPIVQSSLSMWRSFSASNKAYSFSLSPISVKS